MVNLQKTKNNKTRRISYLGILAAMSIMSVYLIHFPILPMLPFMKYDPADIPILVGAFALGPWFGVILTVVTCIVQGLTISAGSGIYGIIMHMLATLSLVVTASVIYNHKKTKKSAIIGLFCGTLMMTVVMVPANYIVTPLFLGVPASMITPLVLYIILFNLIKAGVNSILTFLLYKKISGFLHRKPQK